MQQFRADMHLHTVLSPCGSLEMSPGNIIQKALEKKLDIIAITDHNSTRQFSVIKKLAEQSGIFVIGGAEVNTAEEVHCLALFEKEEELHLFQDYLDKHIRKVKNKPDYFGYQVVVDQEETIIYEEPWLLINALDSGIRDVEKQVHALGGLFIPAHIDRPFNGIISQLGFIPEELQCDAFELSGRTITDIWTDNPKLPPSPVFLRNSDAHQPNDIGSQYSIFELNELSFEEIRFAFKREGNRRIIIDN